MTFVFIDGRIESVCPRADDETWAVNIRRGILSTLQNSMTSLKGVFAGREVDVAGNCPVVYEVTSVLLSVYFATSQSQSLFFKNFEVVFFWQHSFSHVS